jgi:hypothetical protein
VSGGGDGAQVRFVTSNDTGVHANDSSDIR